MRLRPLTGLLIVATGTAVAGAGGMFGMYHWDKNNLDVLSIKGGPVEMQRPGAAVMSKKKMPFVGKEARDLSGEREYVWSAKFVNVSEQDITAYEICFDGVNGFDEVQATECFSSSKTVHPGRKGKIREDRDMPEGDIQKFIVRMSRVRFEDGTAWQPED